MRLTVPLIIIKFYILLIGLNQLNDASLSSTYIVNLQEELNYVIKANQQEIFDFGMFRKSF